MTWWITPPQPVGELLLPLNIPAPFIPVVPVVPTPSPPGQGITVGDLVQRTWDLLGQGAPTFYSREHVVLNGLNPAQNLLVLLKPTLYVLRTLVPLVTDQVFLDVRTVAPRLARLQRVALGDVSMTPPVPTQSKLGDLRKTELRSLRQQRDWFTQRRAYPSHYYRHGLLWVCTWPRATQDLTLTLVYTALPTPLSAGPLDQEQVPDIAAQWHTVLAEVASQILLATDGAGECDAAMQRLAATLGAEPFQALLKTLRALRYRQQANQVASV